MAALAAGHETVSGYGVGKGRPPVATRWGKGVSGNPGGRPKGSHRTLPYEAVLGRMVSVRENGTTKRVETGHALLLHLAHNGAGGNSADAGEVLQLLSLYRARQPSQPAQKIINLQFVTPGSVNWAMRPLRMGTLLYRFEDHARMVIEPWLVEAALARLGDRRLTAQEQRTVVAATRTPHKVRWPAWWTEHPRPRA